MPSAFVVTRPFAPSAGPVSFATFQAGTDVDVAAGAVFGGFTAAVDVTGDDSWFGVVLLDVGVDVVVSEVQPATPKDRITAIITTVCEELRCRFMVPHQMVVSKQCNAGTLGRDGRGTRHSYPLFRRNTLRLPHLDSATLLREDDSDTISPQRPTLYPSSSTDTRTVRGDDPQAGPLPGDNARRLIEGNRRATLFGGVVEVLTVIRPNDDAAKLSLNSSKGCDGLAIREAGDRRPLDSGSDHVTREEHFKRQEGPSPIGPGQRQTLGDRPR
ncbi:hypothetical protein AS850_12805 [Frondihabitans sp. 762G35]|nr:hypothetical protein AS850_12805 [Frondihabitans sp. 762G35]